MEFFTAAIVFAIAFCFRFWLGSYIQKKLEREYAFWWTFFFGVPGACLSALLKLNEK